MQSRKYPAIDLMKLYTLGDHQTWLKFLQGCVMSENVNELVKTRYGLQVGYDDLVKKKMDSEKMAIQFAKWIGALDKAMRMILKKRYPLPHDNFNKIKNGEFNTDKWARMKKKRDQEFEEYLKKSSF